MSSLMSVRSALLQGTRRIPNAGSSRWLSTPLSSSSSSSSHAHKSAFLHVAGSHNFSTKSNDDDFLDDDSFDFFTSEEPKADTKKEKSPDKDRVSQMHDAVKNFSARKINTEDMFGADKDRARLNGDDYDQSEDTEDLDTPGEGWDEEAEADKNWDILPVRANMPTECPPGFFGPVKTDADFQDIENHHQASPKLPKGTSAAEYNTERIRELMQREEKQYPGGFGDNNRFEVSDENRDDTNFQDFTKGEMKALLKEVVDNRENSQYLEDGMMQEVERQLPSDLQMDHHFDNLEGDDDLEEIDEKDKKDKVDDKDANRDMEGREVPAFDDFAISDPIVERHIRIPSDYGEKNWTDRLVNAEQEKLDARLEELGYKQEEEWGRFDDDEDENEPDPEAWGVGDQDELMTDDRSNQVMDDAFEYGDEEEDYFLRAIDPNAKDATQYPLVEYENESIVAPEEAFEAMYRMHVKDPVEYTPRKLSEIFAINIERIEGALKIQALTHHYKRVNHEVVKASDDLHLLTDEVIGDESDLNYLGHEEKEDIDTEREELATWDPRYTPYPFAPGAASGSDYYMVPDGPEMIDLMDKEKREVIRHFETLPEKMKRKQSEFFAKNGALGASRDTRKPELITDAKTRPTRRNIVMTDISDMKNSNFAIVVRDKGGELREPSHKEYTYVRRKEKSPHAKFNYVKYSLY